MTFARNNSTNRARTMLMAMIVATALNGRIAAAYDGSSDGLVTCVQLSESSAMFVEPVSSDVVTMLHASDPGAAARFQLQGSRWTSTRSQPLVGEGQAFTITYSFVLDGTSIPASTWDIDQTPKPSNLFATMDAEFPGGMDAFRQKVREAFDTWQQVTNITYVEVPDDGAAFTVFNAGAVPSATAVGRGDIRIAMREIDNGGVDIDGNGSIDRNVLAYNSYPGNGGDMVLDAGNMATFADATNGFRRLKNTLEHEHGHGLGFQHVMPTNNTKLMEPFLNTNFDGPQEDDIRAALALYGDPVEANDNATDATPIGSVALSGSTELHEENLAIERNGENDFYKFSATGGSRILVEAIPVGTTYQQGAQPTNSDPSPPLNTVNALAARNLRLRVLRNGSPIATSDNAPAGGVETADVTIPADGLYYIWVDATDSGTQPQRYELAVTRESDGGPEIRVAAQTGTAVNIESGVNFNFGSAALDADQHYFFTIDNDGTSNLLLTGAPIVEIGGQNPQDFVVNLQPNGTSIAPGSTLNFNIGFNPSATGSRSATVFIDNNDDDESDFSFNVFGVGTQSQAPVGGESLIRVFQITPSFQFGKVEVTEGGFSDFPEAFVGDDIAIFYSIENHGDGDLTLSGNPIIDVNSGISGFTALGQPNGSPIPAGNPEGFARSFRIRWQPTALGTKTARVFINSNASNTSGAFDFTLRGVVVEEDVVIDDCNGNGIDDANDLTGNDCNNNGIPDECDADSDGDGVPDACDICDGEDDLRDSDNDGTVDCMDECPLDGSKIAPGNCGCGVVESADCGIDVCPDGDDDFDGVCNSEDLCPGLDDLADLDGDGTFDCLDNDVTPEDPGTPEGNDNTNDPNGNDNTGNNNNDNGNDNAGDNNGGNTGNDGNNDGNGNDDQVGNNNPCGAGMGVGVIGAGAFAFGGRRRRRTSRSKVR
ncbi:MAG: choice-of-anchor D domain-containing protein [Phycisphaerales bacterium]|nr:choice-of-anchor D domain-containing protein [Phycisphaerales bacterium]MCB9862634.1 choice-of-anchor D domain-containing protein [Phycisphaerales bacterium]